MKRFNTQYLRLVALGVTLAMGAIGALNMVQDPYGIFGHNLVAFQSRPINVQTRYAKAMQALILQPRLVLLGSSRTYRGFDPRDLSEKDAYNLGVSSLRIQEAVEYIELLRNHTPLQTLVWGLDFFSFDISHPTEPGFDPEISQVAYPIKGVAHALWGSTTLSDGMALWRKPEPLLDADGVWHRNGWKKTYPRTSTAITKAWTAGRDKVYRKLHYDPAMLQSVGQTLQRMAADGIDVRLYFSPIHARTLDAIKDAGKLSMYQAWKFDLIALAEKQGQALWDYDPQHPALHTSLANGSNDVFIDASHLTPDLGRQVLAEIGLSMRQPIEPTLPRLMYQVAGPGNVTNSLGQTPSISTVAPSAE